MRISVQFGANDKQGKKERDRRALLLTLLGKPFEAKLKNAIRQVIENYVETMLEVGKDIVERAHLSEREIKELYMDVRTAARRRHTVIKPRRELANRIASLVPGDDSDYAALAVAAYYVLNRPEKSRKKPPAEPAVTETHAEGSQGFTGLQDSHGSQGS
jgi:hypothetical protein